jgi:hypothetical protein
MLLNSDDDDGEDSSPLKQVIDGLHPLPLVALLQKDGTPFAIEMIREY